MSIDNEEKIDESNILASLDDRGILTIQLPYFTPIAQPSTLNDDPISPPEQTRPINDQGWEEGDNREIALGQQQEITPKF